MLNPFPDLLMLGFFAPTLVRVVVGALFVYAGYRCWQKRDSINSMTFPIVGKAEWVAWFGTLAYLAIGAMLVFGYYTQIGALLGLFAAGKGFYFNKRYSAVYMYSRTTYILVFVICLSLLLSGAGAFAFDLPL